ncbi:MAG: hypothetical protein ACOCP8_09155 [archaeon]
MKKNIFFGFVLILLIITNSIAFAEETGMTVTLNHQVKMEFAPDIAE